MTFGDARPMTFGDAHAEDEKQHVFGLLGHGIARSLTPPLHVILGSLSGRGVRYPLFDQDASFVESLAMFLDECEAAGHAGINVTHPFKELVCAHIEPDPVVAMLGACNTVCFRDGRKVGHNTDFTGLQAALQPVSPPEGFGIVAQLGTGGFGRAAAFALAELGVSELRLFDPVPGRADLLANHVRERASNAPPVIVCETTSGACTGASGVVNCSPIGMHHHPGNPVTTTDLASAEWVFDAVYIPMETEFLQTARSKGIHAISGSELFFWQAIHAFAHFTDSTLTDEQVHEARRLIWPEVIRRSESGE